MQNFVDTLRYFIELSLQVPSRVPLAVSGHEATAVRLSWGPCGFIFPWNFPVLLVDFPVPAELMTTASAIAVAETVVNVCSVGARIKWPNDVMINGKRLRVYSWNPGPAKKRIIT